MDHSGVSNLAGLVRAAATATPAKAALVFRGTAISWGELDSLVDRAAAALLGLGLQPGDRVAVVLPNSPEFAVSYFGALRAGLVMVPVNTTYTPREVGHLVTDSGARVAIATQAQEPALTELLAGGALERVVIVGGKTTATTTAYDELLASVGSEQVSDVGGGEDLALLIYTSGTSGKPRGAMLTHRALLANLQQADDITPPVVTSSDVVLLVLPLFHIYGLNPGLGAVAFHGATGVLIERFDPVDTLRDITREHVTTVVGAPPMYVAWSLLPDAAEAFSSVRLLLSGAAPLPPEVLHRILDATGHHVFEGYGLTETAPVLTTTLMSEAAKAGSIGRAVPGVELRLLDEDGEDVDEEDSGEIVVRGANLFQGYWPDAQDGPDAAGWFRTGDVAYADEDGDLHLVDRRKELVLVSGFNVYPREVEDALLAHPEIEEAAAIGIPHPYTGESVKAMVVLRAGSKLSADDVITFCAHSLARFKCPTAVEFVDELPHSVTGKVSKARLREAFGQEAVGA